MGMTELKSSIHGTIGYLHEVECKDTDSILIFQLPRKTEMLSKAYIEGAMSNIRGMLPEGRSALILGADVNVYELAGADALILKLKGLL